MIPRVFVALLVGVMSSSVTLHGQAVVEHSILTGATSSAAAGMSGVGSSIGGIFEKLNQIQSRATQPGAAWESAPAQHPTGPLPGPDLLDLAPRKTSVLMGLNIRSVLESPMARTMERELERSNPEFQEWVRQTGFNPLTMLEEVVISTAGGRKNPPMLMVVRGYFDEQVRALVANAEGVSATEIAGSAVFTRPPKADSPVQGLAFLDATTAVAGDLDSVKKYLQNPPASGSPGDLQAEAKAARGNYDFWIVADSPGNSLPASAAPGDPQQPNPWNSIMGLTGGVRFGPDIEVGAELLTKNEDDATQLATTLQTLGALFTSGGAGKDKEEIARLVEAVQFSQQGRRILFSLTVPESEVIAALRSQNRGGDVSIQGGARPSDEVLTIHASPRDGGTRVIRLSDVTAP